METKSSAMRFHTSASIYVYVNEDAYFHPKELEDILKQGVKAVSPWRSTRGQAMKMYVTALNLHWRHESLSRHHSFATYVLSLHIGSTRLGGGQLFAFQWYVESVVKAIPDLQIPGIAAVSANVNFSVSVNANASTALAREVIAKGHTINGHL